MTNGNELESWIESQAVALIDGWSKAAAEHYPDSVPVWTDPSRHLEHLSTWFLPSVEELDWPKFLPESDAKVLDLGAGTGWLSAYLSKFSNVSHIDCLDSDTYNLANMLPQIVELMRGNWEKIQPVLGMFEPILRPDNTYDLIVASSSIHHAPNLQSVLAELARVVTPNGHILLLNELPRSHEGYFRYASHLFRMALERIASGHFGTFDEHISSTGITYDLKLGDIAYAEYHYIEAARAVGLSADIIVASDSIPPISEDLRIKHFHLQPADNRTEPQLLALPALSDPAREMLARLVDAIPGGIMTMAFEKLAQTPDGASDVPEEAHEDVAAVEELLEAHRRAEAAEQLVRKLVASRSWRLTRPLRWLARSWRQVRA